MPIKLALQLPHIFRTAKKERKKLEEIIRKEQLDGLISDNRFGIFSPDVPSVYLTHQVKVLSGLTTWLTTKIHRHIIDKYDYCWIPDSIDFENLSGAMGHISKQTDKIKYIGQLSRFKPIDIAPEYDILVLLSGPEPQRGLLEYRMLETLQDYKGSVCMVRGVFESPEPLNIPPGWQVKDHLLSAELEQVIARSHLVISRSGYSTIMDLAAMGKKAFFIPTPGQTEQEYLAKRLDRLKIAPFTTQEMFIIEDLKKVETYSGFKAVTQKLNSDLFEFFKGK